MSDSSSASKDGPFEEQRRIFDLLSQETRHLIVQYVLGHPKHLASLDELNYVIPKSKAAISDQLDNLVEAGILDLYRYEPSEDKRDLPSKFYGFTERGVEVLYEYNYLRGVPVARALYKNTRKSEKIERHEDAPRPELPDEVREGLSNGTSDEDAGSTTET
ncbi:ArsR family transcriptional regulator [Halorussus sp. AFM4]|uniref:ArsR family transcriptional regulator n=1 Tax=Halorussus sp. AFM4 TaxID=3421651 RepID=UPI003EC14066